MDFKRIDQDTIEIKPGELTPERVLKEMARVPYQTADSPLPAFIQPFEVPAPLVDFKGLITDGGLHMDYLNGKQCNTDVKRRNDQLFFNANRFSRDRGSPDVFVNLLEEKLNALKKDFGDRLWSRGLKSDLEES